MRKRALFLIIPIAAILFNILIILYPSDAMDAAKLGAQLWFNSVMPSLLPFFIGTNLLIGLGAVDFLGVLLEPVMRPLFGVPGCGGFALVMGMTSGYPVGAKITASLKEEGKINEIEAQRLLSFVNNSGPLFMIGAIGAGMFRSEKVGYFILIINFVAAIITGILFKYYCFDQVSEPIIMKRNKALIRAFRAMEKARKCDGRPLGKLLGDSVFKSMESILQIAGFIILFCTIISVLQTTAIFAPIDLISNAEGIVYGIVEVTNGAFRLSQKGITKDAIIITASLVSFGGLSIFCQSIAFLAKADINFGIYFLSKIVNAAITAIIGLFLYPFLDFREVEEVTAVFAVSPIRQFMASTMICAIVLLSVIITAVAINISLYIREKSNIL